LISLQNIQKKWLTPPDSGDNRWEFQAIFYNPNINLKKFSKGRKYLIPEDFGFKPDSYILSLKLTDICHKGELDTNEERLEKVFSPLNCARRLSVNKLRANIRTFKTLFTNKFPSLSLQNVPDKGFYFEELSDLFYVSKKGGQNYSKALNPVKIGQKTKIDAEKSRFGCQDTDTEIILNARRALHWQEINNQILDTNLKLYYGKTKFAAQLSNFVGGDRHCTSCLAKYGNSVDETFIHGCYDCPDVKKHYQKVAEILRFSNVDTLTPKDTFVWKRYYKRGLERDFDKEIYFKFINLHVYAELTKSKKYGNQPTISNLCNTICGAILNTITFFPNGKLTYALNRQSITRELLMSGFSPWVQSKLLLYEAIDKF